MIKNLFRKLTLFIKDSCQTKSMEWWDKNICIYIDGKLINTPDDKWHHFCIIKTEVEDK